MQAQEPQPENLVLRDEVPNVRAREPGAGGTSASVLERPRVAGEAGVPEADPPARDERGARTRGAGWQHAIEQVDAPPDDLEDALGVADAHEIARLVLREQRRGPPDGLEHLVSPLPDREPAERVAVEGERGDLFYGAPPELGVDATLGDAEPELPRCTRSF